MTFISLVWTKSIIINLPILMEFLIREETA